MADTTSNSKQDQRSHGIAAAAIEGAKQGEQSADRNEVSGSLARPAPGMTEQPEPSHSSTNQYTGVTGGLTEEQEDDEQEWRRAGGGAAPDDGGSSSGGAGRSAAP